MPNISINRVRAALVSCAASKSAYDRGRKLELLIAYIFGRCDGVRHWKNNVLNDSGSSEVDVCFWNNRWAGSLDFIPRGLLIIECKNTNARVTSATIRNFRTKLEDMDLRFGILIAANGVTGDPRRLTAAHDAIRVAFLTRKIRILVITRQEIETIAHTDDLIEILQDKIMALTLQASTF